MGTCRPSSKGFVRARTGGAIISLVTQLLLLQAGQVGRPKARPDPNRYRNASHLSAAFVLWRSWHSAQ
jgi:hypothetical protein